MSGFANILNGNSPSTSKRPLENASSSTATGSASPRKAPRTSVEHTYANGSRAAASTSNGRASLAVALKPTDSYSPRGASKPLADDYELDPTQAQTASSGQSAARVTDEGDEDITPHASSSSSGTARPTHTRTSEDREEVREILLEDEEGDGEAYGTGDDGEEGGEGDEGDEGTEGDSEEDEEDEDDEEDEEEDDASVGSVDIDGDDREGSADIVYLSGGVQDAGSPPIIKKEPSLLPDDVAAVTDAAAGEGSVEGAVNQLVVKKKRPARPRSPSEDAPAPALPVLTVRLEIPLPTSVDHEDYPNWNVLDMAREQGMVSGWNTDVVEAGPSGLNGYDEGDDVDAGNGDEGAKEGPGDAKPIDMGVSGGDSAFDHLITKYEHLDGPVNKRKSKSKSKAKKGEDAYDIEDDFIDDSEIQQDAPTHYARTVKEGFFAQLGPVDVVFEEPAKAKPRANGSRRPPKAAPTKVAPVRKSLARITGEKKRRDEKKRAGGIVSEEPDSVYIDPEEEADEVIEIGNDDVDRTVFVSASNNPDLLPPFPSFPPVVRASLMHLRAESKAHPWDLRSKGKFPANLHEPLYKACVAAWQHDMFDVATDDKTDNWFAALPSCLPYNTFTLKKLSVKKNIRYYWDFLQECEETGLEELRKLVDAGKAEYEEKKKLEETKFQEALAKWDAEHGADGSTPAAEQTNGTSELLAPDISMRGEGDTSDIEVEAAIKVPNERPKKPITRFTLSGEISTVMIQLYENAATMRLLWPKAENLRLPECADMNIKESTQTTKLNQKIMQCFPADSVSSTMLSRQKTKVAGKKQVKDENK